MRRIFLTLVLASSLRAQDPAVPISAAQTSLIQAQTAVIAQKATIVNLTAQIAALQAQLASCTVTPPVPAGTSVTAYGAIGDGMHDDRPNIQAAINAVAAQGGGIVTIPVGTYLLNSYSPSPHPWYFYNLRVGSNVSLVAASGAKLIQGSGGRSPMVAGATEVRNSVVVFGSSNYVSNTFQDPSFNGGWMTLKATTAGSTTVTLATPAQVSRFKVGDYVAIYAATTGDVVPSESTQVTAITAATGVLTLKYPLARAFATPSIANVNSLMTVNVGMSNLIVQGAEPLATNELFGLTITNSQFISVTSIGGGNDYGLNMNNNRNVSMIGSKITYVDGAPYIQELSQRNSQNVTLDHNTFDAVAVGTGEYGAHWIVTNNTFNLHPEALSGGSGVAMGGVDMLFSGNTVAGTNTAGVNMLMDVDSVDALVPLMGNIRMLNNNITCHLSGGNCIGLVGTDTVFSGNTVTLIGSGQAILVQGPVAQAVKLAGNKINVQNASGIVINTVGADSSAFTCNTLVATNGNLGLYMPGTGARTGKDTVVGNVFTGFMTPFVIGAGHTGTVVDSSTATCP